MTVYYDPVIESQSSKYLTVNSFFEAAQPAILYGRRELTCNALTWGYHGGVVTLTNGTLLAVANGTVTLAPNKTYTLVAEKATGLVTAIETAVNNTLYWTLYTITTGTSTVSSYADKRKLAEFWGLSTPIAAAVPNVPAGGITATNVQAAIDELDTEKAPKESPVFTGQALYDSGTVALPSVAIGGTGNGFSFAVSALMGSVGGVRVFSFRPGSNSIGIASIASAFLNLEGENLNSAATGYGQYTKITFTTNGTNNTEIRQNYLNNIILDDGTARTIALVRGFISGTPGVSGMHASSSISGLRHFDAAAVPDTRFVAVMGYYSAVAEVAGVNRYGFYAAGTADNYFAGRVIQKRSIIDQSYSVQTPTSGFTITIGDTVGKLLLTPAGALAAGTINMPADPFDGQIVTISSTYTVTALTMSGNGKTLNGPLTTIAANGFASWIYVAASRWFRIG